MLFRWVKKCFKRRGKVTKTIHSPSLEKTPKLPAIEEEGNKEIYLTLNSSVISLVYDEVEEGINSARYGRPLITLGKGTYSSVKLHRDSKTDSLVAIKSTLSREYEEYELTDDIIREFVALKTLSNQNNIIGMLSYDFDRSPQRIALEKADFHLGDLIYRYDLEDAQKMSLLKQLMTAVKIIHSVGIVHRDIKPENCLVMNDGVLKLADFGSSRCFYGSYEIDPNLKFHPKELEFTPIIYTLWWRSPEVLLQEILSLRTDYQKVIVTKADIWAVGMCMFNMLAGKDIDSQRYLRGSSSEIQLWKILRAFDNDGDETALSWQDKRDIYEDLADESDRFSKNWLNLLKKRDGTCKQRMERRLNAEIVDNAWNLLSRLLALDVSKRIEIEDAINHPFFNSCCFEKKAYPKPKEMRRSTIVLGNSNHISALKLSDWIVIASWIYRICLDFHISFDCLFITVKLIQITLLTLVDDISEWKSYAAAALIVTARYMGKYVPTKDMVFLLDEDHNPESIVRLEKEILKCHAPVLCSKTSWSIWIEENGHIYHPYSDKAKDVGSILFLIEISTIPLTKTEKMYCANLVADLPMGYKARNTNLLLLLGHLRELNRFVLKGDLELDEKTLKLFQVSVAKYGK